MNTSIRRAGSARFVSGFAAAAALCAIAAPAGAQTWVAYDDFSTSTSLSSTRWSGDDGRQAAGLRLESRRAIVGGQLRLEGRSVGDNVRSEGLSQTRNAVVFTNSPDITAMKATVTMRTGSIGSCAGNTTSTGQTRARLFGFFFNAGTPVIGSFMNETFAGIQVARNSNSTDAAGVYRVSAFIGICTDDNCVNSKTLSFQETLTNVALNQPVELSVAWDRTANAFKFTTNGVLTTLGYTVSDARASTTPTKRMEVSSNIQQCAGSRVSASVGADFDNVQTNSLASVAAVPTVYNEPAAETDQHGAN